MLDDTQRKVLRILFSLNRYELSILHMDDLKRFAQRTPLQLLDALRGLKESGFIEWDAEQMIVKVLLLGEERPSKPTKKWWEYD